VSQSRRRFLSALGPDLALLLAVGDEAWSMPQWNVPERRPSSDAASWRRHFPALDQRVNGRPLVYLDSAATAQRPRAVIDQLTRFYGHDNANPSATLHTLARRADAAFQAARTTVARFINAADPLEIVWTRGTTEGINLVATAWGGAELRQGDEIVLTVAEHASAMLPWQLAARRAGATIRYLDVDDEGRLDPAGLDRLLSTRTRLVAFTHVSNVTGAISPARELCRRARAAGARVMIDAAQSAPHFPIDVQDLSCDFLAFSGHKVMGPMGSGVLWVRRELLDAMPPYQAGSNAAHGVGYDSADWSPGGLRFGAGTPNAAGAIGLAAAIGFLQAIGPEALWKHEQLLVGAMLQGFEEVPRLRLLGPTSAADRISLFSFHDPAQAPLDLVERLDRQGIAIRAGDLAALPLLQRLGVDRAARASLYLYNSPADVRRLFEILVEPRGR
jgi:cysteine desulfurase / selenocysteine lyase